MLIDFNSLAKACYNNKYELPPTFDEHEQLSDINVQEAYKYLGMMEDNNSFFEFRGATIELLKTILTIAYIKQINLNDFFNISLNLPER
jgi:hypothetical protein